MKLTIIPSDKALYKDDVCLIGLAFQNIPSNIHALQWIHTKGWIEFVEDENFFKPLNESIDSLPDWALSAITVFDEAKAVNEALMLSNSQIPSDNTEQIVQ